MNLRAKLLCYTAAIAITAGAAMAAETGQQIAERYLADGYSYVEVKVGPTLTKIEAIKDGVKYEIVIENETGTQLSMEQEVADAEDAAKTGSEVKSVTEDPEVDDDDDDDDEDDDN